MEIDISSTLDIDQGYATASTNSILGVRSLFEIDASDAEVTAYSTVRAIASTIDADSSVGTAILNTLKSTSSTFDVDQSQAIINLSTGYGIASTLDIDQSFAEAAINLQRNLSSDFNGDTSSAEIELHGDVALASTFNTDISFAQIKYLYLKNPPLQSELSGGVEVRGQRKPNKFNKSQLVVNNTYTLDAVVDGERLDGVQLVLTVRSLYPDTKRVVFQKSTLGTPDEYLVSTTGRGDIFLSTPTPVVSGNLGSVQEVLATIIIKPDDFTSELKLPMTYAYELWGYDLVGTNTLLEAGTFSVTKT